MLACERWTLTHSSGWAAGLAGLALALPLGSGAMNASRVAEAVAEGEVWDDAGEDDGTDGEDELVWDGEPGAELDAAADAEPEPEPDRDADVLLGVLVGSVPDDAWAVGEAEELEELGEEEGDGEFDVGAGVGVGVDVAAAGSTSQLVSVPAPGLVEVLGLAETASALIASARAVPGQPASTPRVTDPPATRLSAAARTCARRMKTALFSAVLRGYCLLLRGSLATG